MRTAALVLPASHAHLLLDQAAQRRPGHILERPALDVADALPGPLHDTRRVIEQGSVRQLHVHVLRMRGHRYGEVAHTNPARRTESEGDQVVGKVHLFGGVGYHLAHQGGDGVEDRPNLGRVTGEEGAALLGGVGIGLAYERTLSAV